MGLAGFDTDRRSFLGRGGDPRRPHGIVAGLAGTLGWTLDPVMSLQVRLELEPRPLASPRFDDGFGEPFGKARAGEPGPEQQAAKNAVVR